MGETLAVLSHLLESICNTGAKTDQPMQRGQASPHWDTRAHLNLISYKLASFAVVVQSWLQGKSANSANWGSQPSPAQPSLVFSICFARYLGAPGSEDPHTMAT